MYRSISSKLVTVVTSGSLPVSDSEIRNLVRESLGFLNEGTGAGVAVPQNMNLTSVTVRDPIAPGAYVAQSAYFVSEFFGNLGNPVAEAAQAHSERKDQGASKFRRALNLCAHTWGLVGSRAYVEGALKYGLKMTQDGQKLTSAEDVRPDGVISYDYIGMMRRD